MLALVDNLLNILQGASLIKNTRIVSYDETPAGQLEIKI